MSYQQPYPNGQQSSPFFTPIISSSWRRPSQRYIGGVCASLAQRSQIDVTLIRGIAIVALIIATPLALILYTVAWMLIPDEATTRIELDECLHGRFTITHLGIILLLIGSFLPIGLFPRMMGLPLFSTVFFGIVDSDVADFFQVISVIAIPALIIAAIVIVAVSSHRRTPPPPGSPAPGSPVPGVSAPAPHVPQPMMAPRPAMMAQPTMNPQMGAPMAGNPTPAPMPDGLRSTPMPSGPRPMPIAGAAVPPPMSPMGAMAPAPQFGTAVAPMIAPRVPGPGLGTFLALTGLTSLTFAVTIALTAFSLIHPVFIGSITVGTTFIAAGLVLMVNALRGKPGTWLTVLSIFCAIFAAGLWMVLINASPFYPHAL